MLQPLQQSDRHRRSRKQCLSPVRPRHWSAGGYRCTHINAPLARYQITAPTLIVGVRNDRYGTNACDDYTASRIAGAKFIGSDTGGHARAGHNTEVIDAVPDLLTRIASDPSHDPQPD